MKKWIQRSIFSTALLAILSPVPMEVRAKPLSVKQDAAPSVDRTLMFPSIGLTGMNPEYLYKSPNQPWGPLVAGYFWDTKFVFTVTQTQNIPLTLVQWTNSESEPAKMYYEAVPVGSNAAVSGVPVYSNWTQFSFNTSIPNVPPGQYFIRVRNNGMLPASGNFYVYY